MPNSQTAQLQSQIRDAEARFDVLLDAAVDAIIQIDARGHIQRFNQAAEHIFGYSPDEVIGKNISVLMPEPYRSQHDSYIERYLRTHEARIIGIGREVYGQHKTGRIFPIELSVGEVLEGDHSIFVGIIRDISERKRAEVEASELRNSLAHVARVGSLGEMASGIAHELNQPLTAIASYARASRRLLENGEKNREQGLDTLDKIADQAERAGEIIRRLRGFLRRTGGEREALSCNELIRELLTLLDIEFRDQPIQLRLDLGEGIPQVTVDRIQIQQVLLNLVRNAIDAMGESACGDEIVVSSQLEYGSVTIKVSDRGPGIDMRNIEQLFEPFYTTKTDGMGMGLSLCRTILRAHGGSLSATNNPEGGACFILRLPVKPA